MNARRNLVDHLLHQYEEYKILLSQEGVVSRQLAKAKLTGSSDIDLRKRHDQLKAAIQQLSDAMTFSDPIVWMMYKFEAYKDEAQPIRTMQDFRVHCSKDGYICTKRFEFLDAELAASGSISLNDTEQYPDELLLDQVFGTIAIEELCRSQAFKEKWDSYEYHSVDGTIAKWANYESIGKA